MLRTRLSFARGLLRMVGRHDAPSGLRFSMASLMLAFALCAAAAFYLQRLDIPIVFLGIVITVWSWYRIHHDGFRRYLPDLLLTIGVLLVLYFVWQQ